MSSRQIYSNLQAPSNWPISTYPGSCHLASWPRLRSGRHCTQVPKSGAVKTVITKNVTYGPWELWFMNYVHWRFLLRHLLFKNWWRNWKRKDWKIFPVDIVRLWMTWFIKCYSLTPRKEFLQTWSFSIVKDMENMTRNRMWKLMHKICCRLSSFQKLNKDGSI